MRYFKFLVIIGGWNETPRFDEMYHVAKHWEEDFQAEIIDIGKDLNAEPACRGRFEELRSMIKEKLKFSIWWD